MYLADILGRYSDAIVGEWVDRLHNEVCDRYSLRPREELLATVSRANDACFSALVENDFSRIDSHIEWITQIRLEGGFALSEVQNAYELYRIVLLPILTRELRGKRLLTALTALDRCLFYTITRFSDYFQQAHEREIKEHAMTLTASLAHEIRNPLSSVKMNVQILSKSRSFDGNNARRMDIVVREISRLERILDEMLDYARPLKLDFEPSSIKEIVESCLDIVDVRIREKSIIVKKNYSRGAAPALVDRDKMEQAIINVFINSIDALSPGGEITVISRAATREDRAIRIEISDNGKGISPMDLPYIFDPFYSNKKMGTGLGLTNVKKIVEAHGGTVTVAPGIPKGTRFCFAIPARGVA